MQNVAIYLEKESKDKQLQSQNTANLIDINDPSFLQRPRKVGGMVCRDFLSERTAKFMANANKSGIMKTRSLIQPTAYATITSLGA